LAKATTREAGDSGLSVLSREGISVRGGAAVSACEGMGDTVEMEIGEAQAESKSKVEMTKTIVKNGSCFMGYLCLI
jgi:hypothetical protein